MRIEIMRTDRTVTYHVIVAFRGTTRQASVRVEVFSLVVLLGVGKGDVGKRMWSCCAPRDTVFGIEHFSKAFACDDLLGVQTNHVS